MQKCFREHPTRRVLVRALCPPQSGRTRTRVLCYTGRWYSRSTWSWKFWEISRRLRCGYNQSTLYTACMCRHLEERGEQICHAKSKGHGKDLWEYRKTLFPKNEWAGTSLVDGQAGVIIVAVSDFRAFARVVLTTVTFNGRALKDKDRFFSSEIVMQNMTKTHLMHGVNRLNDNTYQAPPEPERTPHTLQQKLS